MASYTATRDRVESYFDGTATKTWERLTSDAPVSHIRQTVRDGRNSMRALMLSRLPEDLRGARVLDAGCGTGAMTEELTLRGATVAAADISPKLVQIARDRPHAAHPGQAQRGRGLYRRTAYTAFDGDVACRQIVPAVGPLTRHDPSWSEGPDPRHRAGAFADRPGSTRLLHF